MKKHWYLIIILLLFSALLLLIAFGQTVGEGVRAGMRLAYRNVLPALFPAAILCGMLGELLEHLPLRPTAALWLTAQLCGFPLGIKTTVRAYRRGLIDREQALRLSRCAVNASPAFLISYLGGTVLDNTKAGLLLYGAQTGISFLLALHYEAFTESPPLLPQSRPFPLLLTESIGHAADGCLLLTAFITAFSAVASLCRELPYFSYWYGGLELTGGIPALPPEPIWFYGLWVGFTGISVLLQNTTVLLSAELSPLPMLQSRLLYTAALPLAMIRPKLMMTLFIFILFLISFDKRRKKSYNRLNVKRERRIL
ncbi:MAG: hypothetical protein IJN82_02235 [Clostridia bacterium]|nr:hypothetical protein [Clostridia bacterium]